MKRKYSDSDSDSDSDSVKRIIVTGLPGSGKSTFAQTLSVSSGLPVLRADDYRFTDKVNWVKRPLAEFQQELNQAVLNTNNDTVIIEGADHDGTDPEDALDKVFRNYISSGQCSKLYIFHISSKVDTIASLIDRSIRR